MMAYETANSKTNDLWWKMLSSGVTAAALGIVSFLYATAFLVAFNIPVRIRDDLLFLFGGFYWPQPGRLAWAVWSATGADVRHMFPEMSA